MSHFCCRVALHSQVEEEEATSASRLIHKSQGKTTRLLTMSALLTATRASPNVTLSTTVSTKSSHGWSTLPLSGVVIPLMHERYKLAAGPDSVSSSPFIAFSMLASITSHCAHEGVTNTTRHYRGRHRKEGIMWMEARQGRTQEGARGRKRTCMAFD